MDTYLKLLKQAISFKTISTDPAYQEDILKMVDWLKEEFSDAGFEVEVIKGYDNPLVIAKYAFDDSLETCLVYGHYDVQPASQADGWNEDPFKLLQGEEKLYARGVVDNKGQFIAHMATIFDAIKAKNLKYNIKFLLEGNEETGSDHLEEFIKSHKELLKADFALFSDSELTQGRPVIEAGFRGGINMTLKFQTSSTELHSGIYGGAAPNSLHELVIFLGKLFGDSYKFQLPGFNELAVKPSDAELELNNSLPFDMNEYFEITGTKAMVLGQTDNFYTNTGLLPSVQLTGLKSGYADEGYKNSIPPYAVAKINFRLVEGQAADQVVEMFKAYIERNIPNYVEYNLETSYGWEGTKLDLNTKRVNQVKELLKQAYQSEPIFRYSGGGLPIVTYMKNILKLEPILVAMANEDCNMHAVNENFTISDLQKGLKFSKIFFTK